VLSPEFKPVLPKKKKKKKKEKNSREPGISSPSLSGSW
jgi:hypothetical protein